MERSLQVKFPVIESDNIIDEQYHTYTPFTSSYNNNDEVRIAIQSQDLYVLPAESYLQIEFNVTAVPNANADATSIFAQYYSMHMFTEMRYELNGIEIDRCKNPGITAALKSMLSCRIEDNPFYSMCTTGAGQPPNRTANYKVILPLRFVFGF